MPVASATEYYRWQEVGEVASAQLEHSPYLAIRNVSCESNDGVLVLRGRLSNFYEKQLAQEAVKHVPGVARVVNEIEVVPTLRQVSR